MKKQKQKNFEDQIRKIRKPRSIYKPEQPHKDKRRSYQDDNQNWQKQIEDDIDDYYSDKQD